jgi:hypothetical protein
MMTTMAAETALPPTSHPRKRIIFRKSFPFALYIVNFFFASVSNLAICVSALFRWHIGGICITLFDA